MAYDTASVNRPSTGDLNQYWFVVFPRQDMSIVANVVSPATRLREASHRGARPLLSDNGGGTALAAAEQAAEQAGSAAGRWFVYALITVMGEPIPSIEGDSPSQKVLLPISVTQFAGLWTPTARPATKA